MITKATLIATAAVLALIARPPEAKAGDEAIASDHHRDRTVVVRGERRHDSDRYYSRNDDRVSTVEMVAGNTVSFANGYGAIGPIPAIVAETRGGSGIAVTIPVSASGYRMAATADPKTNTVT